jgi:peptide/nickel transport system substrate-binding protein
MPNGETSGSLDRRGLLRTLGAGGTAILAGCADVPTSRTPADGTATGGESAIGGTYTEALSSDARSLNFLYHDDTLSEKFVGAAMDFSYVFRDVGEIVPLWIESVSEEDKRVWEFTLRDNLRWSEPYGQVTAEDWVYTVRNLYQGEDNWAGVVQHSDWRTTDENGDPIDVEIERTGKLSFAVTLPRPQPAFLANSAMWSARCLPKELVRPYVEKRDATGLKRDEELNSLSYTGNLGPYDFEEWKRESRFVATRSDEYYLRELAGEGIFGEEFAEAPYFERYELRVIPEQSTRLGALRNGELTVYEDVPSDKVEQYRSLDHLKFRFRPNPFCTMVYYNQRANGWELLRRRGVRRALSTAVNKRVVDENIYRGFPTVAHTFQPEWSPYYRNERVEEFGVGDSHSYEAARSTLAEAAADTEYGYDGDSFVGPDGRQVTLQFVYVGTSDLTRRTAEFFAQELGKIGVGVEPVNGGPLNTVQKRYLINTDGTGQPTFNGGPREASTSERPWDLLIGVTLNSFPINPDTSRVYWTEDGPVNFFGYEPEAPLADWYETAKTTTDDATRRETFGKIFGALSREQPVDFLHFDTYKTAFRQDYVGMPPEGEYGYYDGWDRVTWHLR